MITSSLKNFAMQFSDARVFEPILRKLEVHDRSRPRLRILAYHRIDVDQRDSPYYPGLISATPKQFAVQMDFLAAHYHVCSMDDVVAASKGETSLPNDSVLLTFDDATTDFASHAWPVLKSLGLAATLFVPTAFPDNPTLSFWWDALYRAVVRSPNGTILPFRACSVTLDHSRQRRMLFRRLKECLKNIPHNEAQHLLTVITTAGGVADPVSNNVLGWNALRQLDREGVTLAPHTHTHPMLNQLPTAEIRRELSTSCDVLKAETGHRILRTLAYPAGGVNEEVLAAMATEGFKLAFTTRRGVNDQSFLNPYRLRRISVGSRTSLGLLRIQLANWGN